VTTSQIVLHDVLHRVVILVVVFFPFLFGFRFLHDLLRHCHCLERQLHRHVVQEILHFFVLTLSSQLQDDSTCSKILKFIKKFVGVDQRLCREEHIKATRENATFVKLTATKPSIASIQCPRSKCAS
jgi:hypothetical protein